MQRSCLLLWLQRNTEDNRLNRIVVNMNQYAKPIKKTREGRTKKGISKKPVRLVKEGTQWVTLACRAGSTTHISLILDMVDHSGFPGYLPKRLASRCLLTQGRGNSLAWTAGSGLPCSRTALCSSGCTSWVKEQNRDVTMQSCCSCEGILSVRGRKGRWRMKERLKRTTKPGKNKDVWYSLKDKRFFDW